MTPIKPGCINVVRNLSTKENLIYRTAELIWGLKPNNLPKAKFDELERVFKGCLEERYGPFKVKGFFHETEGTFVVSSDPGFSLKSYKPVPCSLDTCMVTDAYFKCSRCMATYCSEEHQRAHWKTHKVTCILKPAP
jgi:hypothetical protein